MISLVYRVITQRNEIFDCVLTDNTKSIVSLTLKYVEKSTEDDSALPESHLL